MDIKIDADLVDIVSRGDLDEWQAMTVQTCRDAAYARTAVDEVKKKIAEFTSAQEQDWPSEKPIPIKLVRRDG